MADTYEGVHTIILLLCQWLDTIMLLLYMDMSNLRDRRGIGIILSESPNHKGTITRRLHVKRKAPCL